MVHMQFNAESDCRAGTTGAALEVVPLENVPAETKGRIAPRSVVTSSGNFNVVFSKFSAGPVGVVDEGPQRVHP